jgi:hypothetical protein
LFEGSDLDCSNFSITFPSLMLCGLHSPTISLRDGQ